MTVLLHDDGVLFSFAPHLDNVKEPKIAECPIYSISDLDHIATTMPNLNPISLSRCAFDIASDNAFEFMSPRDPGSSLPFPHLKRLTVLEPGPGLISLDRRRKEYGVPLETVIIGSEPRLYTPEQIMELGVFVDDVRVEIPLDMPEWSVWNRILDTWLEIGIPGPVSTA